MAKLKFGAWIPTYAWSGKKTDPKNMQRIRESIVKCEKYGIDVWVIDHLLSAPGLYGNAWLEPLILARLRGRPDLEGRHRHRHPGAAGAPSGAAGQGDLDALPPLEQPLRVRGGPRLVRARVRGDRLPHPGARQADRRDHRGGDPAADEAERELPRASSTTSTTSPSTRGPRGCRRSGSPAARACRTPASTTCR